MRYGRGSEGLIRNLSSWACQMIIRKGAQLKQRNSRSTSIQKFVKRQGQDEASSQTNVYPGLLKNCRLLRAISKVSQ